MDPATPDVIGRKGPYLEYCAANRPLPGQNLSGDASMVVDFDGGTLVCVLDGLGHGEEAARAASAAGDVILGYTGEPLPDLAHRCHERLKHTRGIVASFARFDAAGSTMSWLGVGNVEAIVFRWNAAGEMNRASLALRGGVIGYTLPSLHLSSLDIGPGDILVMATDGIAGAFIDNVDLNAGLPEMAEKLMDEFSKPSDDALVLVARYLGGGVL